MHYRLCQSYNLLPKIDKVQDETEAQLTYESVPEQEAPVTQCGGGPK